MEWVAIFYFLYLVGFIGMQFVHFSYRKSLGGIGFAESLMPYYPFIEIHGTRLGGSQDSKEISLWGILGGFGMCYSFDKTNIY
jgi:hypothetical protein